MLGLTRYSYLLQQTEVPPPTSTSEEPSYLENEIEDGADERDEKGDLYYDKDECSMQEYEVMKVGFEFTKYFSKKKTSNVVITQRKRNS